MEPIDLHRALLDPAAYPDRTLPVATRETHISRLYFVGDRVYKVKKPVNFGFLDFGTLERRHFFCHEEVRINQRFAPATYLGVGEIRRNGAHVRIDGVGELVDYCVIMQRLPAERMLASLLDQRAPELANAMEQLGRHLAALHRDSKICRGSGNAGQVEVLRRNWGENFAQVEPLLGPTVSRTALDIMHTNVDRLLHRHAQRLTDRETQGLVRDGHGDLHAEHICLTEPPRIYDCIEFNRRFRVGDILGDLAFLLMDLDFRDRHDLALRLREAWCAALPTAGGPAELLRFFQLYRAFVRGKVDTFLASDASAPAATREHAAVLARRYFNLGLGYLCPPVMILCSGLMGVGKSSVAKPLAVALNATLLRSDVLRKKLAGIEPDCHEPVPFASGLYSRSQNEMTYQALFQQCEELLHTGQSVVVDAAFGRHGDRCRFARLANERNYPLQLVYMHCPPELALQRLRLRQAGDNDPSDGRSELYPAQAADFDYPEGSEEPLMLDTSDDIDMNVQRILVNILLRTSRPH